MTIPAKLYRYRPLNDALLERELGTLRDSYIYAPSFADMNDPMEAFYKLGGNEDKFFDALFSKAGLSTSLIYKPLEEMVKKFGLVSLSSSHMNLPMWAYYSSNFSGMCLEFDTEALSIGDFQGEDLHKVQYEREPLPPITIAKILPQIGPALVSRLTRKRIEWAHEKEWRYITGQVGKKHYLDDALTKVYLGPRVEKCHEDAVCHILEHRPVEILKGEIRDFELHFIKLQPASPPEKCERVGSGSFNQSSDLFPENELQEFLGHNFGRLLDECHRTALRPNMESFGGAGISAIDQQAMSLWLWTKYKLRSGREIFHKRYFDKEFNPIPKLITSEG